MVDVAARIGVPKHTLYSWVQSARNKDQVATGSASAGDRDSAEVRRLKAELKRVTEAREILKDPPRTLPGGKGQVRIHAGAPSRISVDFDVPCPGNSP